jgi:hypothetical protein
MNDPLRWLGTSGTASSSTVASVVSVQRDHSGDSGFFKGPRWILATPNGSQVLRNGSLTGIVLSVYKSG